MNTNLSRPSTLTVTDLPVGNSPAPMALPHFPTRQQAVVWRNWELVPPARLAQVLGTRTANVVTLAHDMGLRVPARVCRDWLDHGYNTIIRNNWHLLPYDQLLVLLGWSAERLAFTLREDDFLWVKLGNHKPAAEPVRYRALTSAEQAATRQLRADARRTRPPIGGGEEPFAFLTHLATGRPSGKPVVPVGSSFDLRLAYSFSASYGDPLLTDGRESYPDGLLARYAALGVNAIWLQSILYTLFPWPELPELSKDWERRLANLKRLVLRARRFGIGVYLYLNEPRGLPAALLRNHPGLMGVDCGELATLCTSLPEVQRFLHDGCAHVFRTVPDLAGVFTITMNENPTSCTSRWMSRTTCPRCSQRPPAELLVETNRLIAEGVHAAAPHARVVAWSWGWDASWEPDIVDRLPTSIELMCVSEWGLKTKVGGIDNTVQDYTISQIGPSEQSLRLWQRAQARGLRTIAKIQVNNSWEHSCVPWLPVPDLVAEHLRRLRTIGVNGLMLGWTVGGYPGGNLALVDHTLDEMAVAVVGKNAAPYLRRAWSAFSRAFTALPLSCPVLYHSPLNVGPANLLHATPSRRKATMVLGFPYDDLAGWRDIYPEDIFEQQLRLLSDGWKRGLTLLSRAKPLVPAAQRRAFAEQERIALASYCHFHSTLLQVRFIRERDGKQRPAALRSLVRQEAQLAQILLVLVRQDSRLGFEAANQYAYTANDLREKTLQCAWLERLLGGKRSAKPPLATTPPA